MDLLVGDNYLGRLIDSSVLLPVLANVVLDELDWALERRGHRFARYPDDCNIFVKSQRAGFRTTSGRPSSRVNGFVPRTGIDLE